jgi:diaminobutyrate-2-oxoglutarate transaminase
MHAPIRATLPLAPVGGDGVHLIAADGRRYLDCLAGAGTSPSATTIRSCRQRLIDDPESGVPPPAGMLVEVVQGEGGSIPVPAAWLRAIRRITADRGIPLIVDEVQTGLGRTGRLFAVQHAGIVPDVGHSARQGLLLA